MRPLPIRLHLSLMVSVLTLLIITVLSIAAYIEFEESLLSNIDATVRYMGAAICAELDEEEVSRENHIAAFRAITGSDNPEYQSQCRVWIEGSDADLFTSDSPGMPPAPGLLHPPAEERPEVGGLRQFSIDDGRGLSRQGNLRAIWMRHGLQGQVANILVARSSDYAYHELREFLQLLLLSGGSITLIVLLLVPRIMSWGLRPITDVGEQMERITHRSLRQESRVMGDVSVELRPFQSALDRMLLRLDEAMRQQQQLTADVAHELRTPLAILKSTFQTLRMQPRTAAEYEEGMDDALHDIGRMEQIVQQLLTLARLDAAEEVADPTEIRLDTLLSSLAEVFGPRAEQQGGRVVYANHTKVSVRGNETELWQLFSNLLDNALRYGPRQGIVRITLEEGPVPWATTCVHDEGGAIPPENMPHLFDRFYRVDASRSQASGGSGLGLAIAHEIVRRHHGDITITSGPQTGTAVVVRLPQG